MSDATIGVAIVGSGIISHNHAAAIARVPGLRIVAVTDPVDAATKRLADQIATQTGHAPQRHPTMRAALDSGGHDLVVICSPSGSHAELAEEALADGRHVLIEKPLDASVPRARRIVELARRASGRGQVCSVISQHRFDPSTVVVRDAIVAGRFGRMTSAVASVAWWRAQSYYDSAAWRGTWDLDGGGATMNQGIHTVDLLLWLLGKPVEVFAHTGQLSHDHIEVEDVTVATVRFDSGALATVHATTAAYPGLAVRLQVHGSLGSAVIHDDQLEYFHAADDPADPDPKNPGNQAAAVVEPADVRGGAKPTDSFVVGHVRQYQDIVEAIAQGRPPAVTVEDAFIAMVVVRAIYLSASLHRPILVDEVVAGGYDQLPVTGEPGKAAQS